MRDVAVVGFAQTPCVRETDGTTNGVEMLVPIFHEVLGSLGPAQEAAVERQHRAGTSPSDLRH